MGFLDKISGILSDKAGLVDQALGLLNSPEVGGFQGLINKFKNNELGDLVSSWVGTGENLPISADQIVNALGNEKIRAIASKLGISETDVSNGLAALLPQFIDRLTPDGEVPEGNALKKAINLLNKQIATR